MRASLSASLLGVLALSACNNPQPANDTGPTTTPDTGVPTDMGPVVVTCPSGGTPPIPDSANQMGPCCYRVSQAAHESMPELRLRYLHIAAPMGSALASSTTATLLNASLANETFNWLVRGSGNGSDGPFTIQTGYGTRDSTAGTYAFSTMTRYAPVTLNGTLTGEVVTTGADPGTLVVPIFDPAGTTLELELQLHNPEVVMSTFSENRSCIGTYMGRSVFSTPGQLSGYLLVTESQSSLINVPPIMAQLCTLIASSGFTEPTTGHYCDAAQSTWTVKPDSLCATGAACVHDDGTGSTCSHDGTGATPCNAWQLVGDFAAVGVEITP